MITSLLLLWACAGDGDKGTTPTDDTGADDSGQDSGDDSGGDDSGGELDPATVPLDGYCAYDDHYGNFTVESDGEHPYVTGSVSNGVVPATVLTELESEGDCTLWRKEYLFCDPSCEPGYTCDFDGTCVPYPEGQDLGTVTVDGLVDEVSMEPLSPGYSYYDTSLSNPPWTPGEVVVLRSTGGVYDPIELFGVTPDTLVMDDLEWQLTEGAPVQIAWTPPTSNSRAKVRVTMNIDQHGTTPVSAVCWFADDGTGEVPASVIDGLIGYGVTGFPRATATRVSSDTGAVGEEGCVDLWLTTSVEPTIAVTGYTPCYTSEDCPEGQECNIPLQICE